jgi:hypothetical protein
VSPAATAASRNASQSALPASPAAGPTSAYTPAPRMMPIPETVTFQRLRVRLRAGASAGLEPGAASRGDTGREGPFTGSW